MGNEYGPHSDAVIELFTFWESRALLQPDPALERREPSAIEWLRERMTEHMHALAVVMGAAVPPPRIVVYRSLSTLLERATQRNVVEQTQHGTALTAAVRLLPRGPDVNALYALERAVLEAFAPSGTPKRASSHLLRKAPGLSISV